MAPTVPDHVLIERHAAFVRCGTQSAAARELGLSRSALRDSLDAYKARGLGEDGGDDNAVEAKAPEPTRAEVHDAAFWRHKHHSLLKEISALEHLSEKLAGVRDVPYSVPKWALPNDSARGKSVVGCLVSDVHMGEVIDEGEINGINAFDSEICRARLRRYFSAVCQLGTRYCDEQITTSMSSNPAPRPLWAKTPTP